ncbi:Abelson tyrosine-protein kinase 2, partial [Biomphalaria glabrata]
MALFIHVPMCNDPACDVHIKPLCNFLTNHGFSIGDDLQMNGRFSCQFKENFLKCSYTILHECEQLWSKIGHQESIIELLNQDHKKVICISFLDKNCGPSSPNNDLKSFFQDFHVQNLTTEQDVEKFVNTVVTTLQSVSNDEVDPEPEAIAPPRPHPIASKEYVFHKGYINASESVDVLFQRIMFLYSQVRERAFSQQGAFMKYPDVIGYMYVPTVYLRLLPHDMDSSEIIDFSKIQNYTDLKEFINLKEGDTFNISFFLNKIIPELYSSNCALGLATLALSQNHTLGEQSVSMLEQLIFRGHLGSASTNTDTLQSVQILLADALVQLSQSLWSVSRKKLASCQNSKEMTVSRLANVIVLLQMEKLVTTFRADNWQEFETSNDRLSTILNSCKQSENVKTLLRTLEMFFLRSPNKLNRTLQNLLTDISVDELILLAKEVWGKELGLTLLFVFSCFKKLFTTKNIRLVQVLKECVRTKSRISFWNSSLNPIVADIVFRGLTHFVTFCLREASHENIHEICVEVVKLIKSTSKLQPAHEVRKLKQALMFDPSPDIRREVIGLLEKKGLYDQHLDDFLIKELEKMLNPYLQLLDSAVTTTTDKIKVIGTFHQIPVLIQLQRPTILEHKGESSQASQGPQDKQLKLMIEILKQLDHDHILKLFAYRLTTIPKFNITEYYSNNLQDFLANKNKNHKYCNEKTLLLYLLQTSSALEHCHSKNIVHSNLMGASLFLVSKEKVMLGEFSLAVQLNISKEILLRTEDTQSLPIRWTAPETLKERKVSLKSDVAMFGNLMYEVLTHGVLPYSRENLSEEEFFSRAVHFLIEPHRESCFKDDYYKLMLSCTHHRPERRPDIKNVQISLQHFLDNYSDDEVTSYSFPNLHDGTLKPSTQFTRGLPQTKKGYVIPILPKLEKVIQETIHYYKVGQFALFRETVSTHMSRMLVAKVQAGILDEIIPRVDIERVKNNSRTSYVIDIFLPANCSEDLCSLIDNNQVGQSPDSCLHLILKAAEMLKYFHDNNFILGQLKMSDIVIDMTSETLKIYPISLRHMIYKTSSTDSSSTTRQSPYDNIACSFETDVFIFGCFMKELLLKVDAMKRPTLYSEPNTVDSDSVNMEQLNMNSCPASMYTLMDKCMQNMPQDRPKLSEII